ncbi:hypothetical protein P167DRAFT_534740 [Morchella conica CCBAS932]|uniref:Uncharacterized protein n=1 Tax=Morchella conica CCBAS932 TaxID=1392247 RepID=A0A3N4KWA6_9PEZI|nr:hypothetical protein P167DRAFT_534740 [Morchella conica CCBAS932]
MSCECTLSLGPLLLLLLSSLGSCWGLYFESPSAIYRHTSPQNPLSASFSSSKYPPSTLEEISTYHDY